MANLRVKNKYGQWQEIPAIKGKDGIDGIDGIDGRGIVSIDKTGTEGLVDTYTISYTDGTRSTYEVTNGADGEDGTSGADEVFVGATEPTGEEKVWFKKGKNLLDYNTIVTDWRITTNIVNDELIVTKNSEGASYATFNVKGFTIGESYTIKSNSQIYVYKDKIYGTVQAQKADYASDLTFVAEQETYVVAIIIGSADIAVGNTLNCGKVQLEQGTTATEYEPYVEKEIYTKNANGIFEKYTNAEQIETITNSNGTAIKYPDGTMICRGRFTLASQITTAIGGGFYRYLAVDKPFPVEFIEQPTINATPIGEWVMIGTVRCDKSTISNITFFTLNADTTDKEYMTDYIAIGRWK